MIDIIIPAYNAHETIINTLLSINMQTIKDKVKVYIVNDGSDNDYKKIIKLFDDRLDITEIVLKENSGPGVARNLGLDNSYSDYIMFLDADDELYNSIVLEELYKNIGSSDVCTGNTVIQYDNNELELNCNDTHSLHGKLYKRDFIINNRLNFNDTYRSEDNAFHNLFLLLSPKVSLIDIPVYFYKYHPGSLTDVSTDTFIKEHNYNVNWVIKEAIVRKIDQKLIAKYLYDEFVYNYKLYTSKNSNFEELVSSFKEYLLDYYFKYETLLNDDEKLEILNNHNIQFVSFSSISSFVGTLKN